MKNPIQKFYDFLDRPIFPSARIILAVLCIPLGLSITAPLWLISMEAPQYPHGLSMEIHTYTIEGGHDGQDLQEINTLNHYIGMRHLSEDEIPDLGWMPFALGILIILTLRVAAIGNVRALVDHTMLQTYVLGFLAVRFIYKMWVYGHELDPRAPFTVEPFMPVIIGTKEIANFTTHGTPLIGTYYIVAYSTGVGIITIWHLIAGRRAAQRAEREAAAKGLTSVPPPAAEAAPSEPSPVPSDEAKAAG